MSKLLIIFCALLFITVALAHDLNEYNKQKRLFDLNMCYYSINGAAQELKEYDTKMRWEDYRDAVDDISKISENVKNEKSITFSPEIKTQAGHIIFCNRDVAEKIRDITNGAASAR